MEEAQGSITGKKVWNKEGDFSEKQRQPDYCNYLKRAASTNTKVQVLAGMKMCDVFQGFKNVGSHGKR